MVQPGPGAAATPKTSVPSFPSGSGSPQRLRPQLPGRGAQFLLHLRPGAGRHPLRPRLPGAVRRRALPGGCARGRDPRDHRDPRTPGPCPDAASRLLRASAATGSWAQARGPTPAAGAAAARTGASWCTSSSRARSPPPVNEPLPRPPPWVNALALGSPVPLSRLCPQSIAWVPQDLFQLSPVTSGGISGVSLWSVGSPWVFGGPWLRPGPLSPRPVPMGCLARLWRR